jgi:hypothetical protein
VRISLLMAFTLLGLSLVPAFAQSPPVDICEFLKNDTNYAQGYAGYSDLGSTFSVLADNHLGIGTVTLDRNGGSREISKSLATLDVAIVRNDSQEELVGVYKTMCYPHGFLSEMNSPTVETREFTTFIDTNVLACSLDVTNKSKANLTFAPRLRGELPEAPDIIRGAVFDAQSNMLSLKSVEPRTHPNDPDDRLITYVSIAPSFLAQDVNLGGTSGDQRAVWEVSNAKSVFYSISGAVFILAPGKTKRLWVVIGISAGDNTPLPAAFEKAKNAITSDTDLERKSRARWNTLFSKMPPLTGEDGLKKFYYHSACALLRNVGEAGGRFGKNRPCFADRRNSVISPWEASIIALGLGEIDTKLAEEQILILTENIREDGSLPESIGGNWVSQEPSVRSPLTAWAAWRTYRKSKDRKFLERVYEPLCKSTEWFFAHRDSDVDGLCESAGPDGSKMDSPELNGFLVVQMKALARIALVLQKRDAFREWDSRATDLKKRIVQTLYSAEDNCFYDTDVNTHEFRKTVSPSCFIPLWAETPLPNRQSFAMALKYLATPHDSKDTSAFPALAYSSSDSVSTDTAFLMIDVLRRHSYNREAAKARDRLLNAARTAGTDCRAFDVQTGKGVDRQDNAPAAAAIIETILDRFQLR